MAPEIISGKKYSGFKADIYSLGIILFSSVIGYFPFNYAPKRDKKYSLLFNPKLQDKFWKVSNCSNTSEDFKSLFKSMVHPQPEMRPTI